MAYIVLLCEGFKGRIVPEFAGSRTTDLKLVKLSATWLYGSV